MDKQQLLTDVAKKIADTFGGPLKAPGINPVPGEGNPDAEILFIGEAPGFTENQMGRPFVGVSGKLLRKNLVACGLKEDEVFITNIVKFRPPENRDPTLEEIAFFKPFLDEQIKIIDPKIIVTLGRFSMFKFFGEGVSISRIHGIPREMTWEGKKVTIYPMFHPAAALRQGSVLFQFESDFRKLKELLSKQEVDLTDLQKNSSDSNEMGNKNDAEQLSLV